MVENSNVEEEQCLLFGEGNKSNCGSFDFFLNKIMVY